MQKEQISLPFTSHEKWELQSLMNHISKLPEGKFSLSKNSGEQLKQDIFNYFKEAKRQIEDKNAALDWVKDFLVEKKCYAKAETPSESLSKDQIYESIKKLRTLLNEKDRDSECYSIYAKLMVELNNLTRDKLPAFEESMNKSYKLMSFVERDNLGKIAKKVVGVDDLEKRSKDIEEIIAISSKIIRYGVNQEFKELERIEDHQTRMKISRMLDYLKVNCIELDSMYNRENSIKEFVLKLSNSLYTKEDINRKVRSLHPKAKTLFQPLIQEVFTLRDGGSASQRSIGERYSEGGNPFNRSRRGSASKASNKAQQDLAVLRKKKEDLQLQLKELKWFISAINHRDTLSNDKIKEALNIFIEKYEIYDFGAYLQLNQQIQQDYKKLLEKSKKDKEERETAVAKEYEEKLAKITKDNKRLKEENDSLVQKNQESLQERIDLLNRIENYELESKSANTEATSQLQTLKAKLSEETQRADTLKADLEKQQRSIEHLNNYNKQMKIELENSKEEEQRLKEQNALYERTIFELQREKANEASMKPYDPDEQSFEKLEREREVSLKMEEYERTVQQLQFQVKEFQQEKEEQGKALREAETELNKLKELKDIEIQGLRYQLEEASTANPNDDTAELSMQILSLASKNEEYAMEIEKLIKAKEVVQALNKSMHIQKSELKKSLGLLGEKEEKLQKELEEAKSSIYQLYDNYQVAMDRIKELEQKERLVLAENTFLKSEVQDLKESSFQQSDKSSTITNEEYNNLQTSFAEMKEFNDLIRTEYLRYKGSVSNLIAAKVEQEAQKYREAENKIKDNYKKLHENYLLQREKLSALKKENDELRESKLSSDSRTSHSFLNSLHNQDKLTEIQNQYQLLKREADRYRKEAETELASKSLTIMKLQNQLETPHSNLLDLVQYQERIRALEREVEEGRRGVTWLKVELQKKEHEVMRLRGPSYY